MIEVLADAMVERDIPEHIRSDNGPEFVAQNLRKWLAATGAKTLYIEPGSPWENGRKHINGLAITFFVLIAVSVLALIVGYAMYTHY